MKTTIELKAAILIQNKTKKYFVKKYGQNWKHIIKNKLIIETMDYCCERNGIADPWYDYCDDDKFIYKKMFTETKENNTNIIHNYFA